MGQKESQTVPLLSPLSQRGERQEEEEEEALVPPTRRISF